MEKSNHDNGKLAGNSKDYYNGTTCLCLPDNAKKSREIETVNNEDLLAGKTNQFRMIRAYLDWNVVSNYKRDEFKDFQNFIVENKNILQFPYSPAHFKDLMKSYNANNSFFYEDLNNLDYLSETHLLRWGKDGIEFLSATPKEYFESEKDNEDIFSSMDFEKMFDDLDNNDFGLGKMGTFMKSLLKLQPTGIEITEDSKEMLQKMFPNLTSSSSMWDLMKDMTPFSKKLLQDKDYYKDFRKTIGDKGLKLEANSGNWDVNDVVQNIDKFLQSKSPTLTFDEYINSSFKHRKESANRYEYYTTAYLMLDMIGYKQDKLPKPTDNMQNIQNDGEHSFYSAYCDYFVVMDKKLMVKTKVLFKEFNIPTLVVSPEEFIENLKGKLNYPSDGTHLLNEAMDLLTNENLKEIHEAQDENEIDSYGFELPVYYFGFFNSIIYNRYTKQKAAIVTFKKIFKNYSSFIWYTEAEKLIDRVADFFGYEDKKELEELKKEFVYGEKEIEFSWKFEGGFINLKKDAETHLPLLIYGFLTND